MKQIEIDEQKEIMLSIMDEIDAFCTTRKLKYFLVGGTLLGAIRHKGFIPWDDDMDIGMPRADYEIFIKEFRSESGNVIVDDFRTKKRFIWPSAKAVDKRTSLQEVEDKKIESGIFIDVFPFDGINSDYETAVKIVKKAKFWKDLLTIKYLSTNKSRGVLKNLTIRLGKALYAIPDSIFIKKINYGLRHYEDLKNCKYICNFTGAWGVREISLASNFYDTVNAPFENRMFRIPIGYEDYLKTVYGDYMTPPPIEKQKSTHTGVAYWKE